MKNIFKTIITILSLTLTTWLNAFTYQGELSQTGLLFDGTADIRFSLFDADMIGSQVGVTDVHTFVTVSNGRFVVDLDQWVALYDGTPLWLEIEVDLNSTGSFTTLNPRQKLQPAPYAEYAYDAAGGLTSVTSENIVDGTIATIDMSDNSITRSKIAEYSIGSNEIEDETIKWNHVSDNAITKNHISINAVGTSEIITSQVQQRVIGTCPVGELIRSIAEDGSVFCEVDNTLDANNLWSTSGNAGTDPATNFIGSTDNQAFEVRTNGIRSLRIEQATLTTAANIVGGSSSNEITSGVIGSVISGGGNNQSSWCGINNDEVCSNKISGDYGFIGGGYGNRIIQNEHSSISGGYRNNISGKIGKYGSIGGGYRNSILNSLYSTINGGKLNNIEASFSTIAGGKNNNIGNDAFYSWAGGLKANVDTDHWSSFVWNGSYPSEVPLTTTSGGQFLVKNQLVWFGNLNTSGGVFPNIVDWDMPEHSFFNIDAESNGFTQPNPLRVRYNDDTIFMIFSNKGTTIGGSALPADNGLRVAGQTHLMDRLGVNYPNPLAQAHINAPSGTDGLRVMINSATKLRLLENGGLSVGANYEITDTPTNGLRVKGNVEIVGSLSKGGGSFKIDHPLDPENKYLYHSFVESPDMMNIYNGNIMTDKNGEAWVEMPEWFEALNMEFRYQLTVIGSFDRAMIAEEIVDNKFLIRTESGSVKVSWQVTGVRHDAWAEKNRIPIEEQKQEQDKGKYLHPKSWNVDEKQAIGYTEE